MILDSKWTSQNELKYLKEVLSNSEAVRKNSFTDRLEHKFKKKLKKTSKLILALRTKFNGICE